MPKINSTSYKKGIVISMENLQWNWINKYLISGEYVIWNGKSGTGHSIYVITNKRIFSFRDYEIQTLDYHTKLSRKVTRHQDGSGSIRYCSVDSSRLYGYFDPAIFPQIIHFELENIPNVDHVLRILSN